MWFFADRTGFPWLALPDVGLEMQLLPTAKLQLEQWIAEPNAFGDSWYEEVLKASPRLSYRRFEAAQRESLFAGALRPEEALDFAHWLGSDLDLPTVGEWRQLYRALADLALPGLEEIPVQGVARVVLQRLWEQLAPSSLLELSLLRGGLIEWARQGPEWVGLGAPRPAFWPHLWNPLVDVVRPLRPEERLRHFGFRLLRRLED
ncbi:MAG: hypothetical protein JXA37_03975 [Chloroflexia bacterium]|nr:hypothetical protein [Chloroflexia bacterium]